MESKTGLSLTQAPGPRFRGSLSQDLNHLGEAQRSRAASRPDGWEQWRTMRHHYQAKQAPGFPRRADTSNRGESPHPQESEETGDESVTGSKGKMMDWRESQSMGLVQGGKGGWSESKTRNGPFALWRRRRGTGGIQGESTNVCHFLQDSTSACRWQTMKTTIHASGGFQGEVSL